MERRKLLKVVRSHGLQITTGATDGLLEAQRKGTLPSDLSTLLASVDIDKCA